MAENPDEALNLLGLMAQATDQGLAMLARRMAGRLVLDLAKVGPARSRGTGRLVRRPASPDHPDLDIDASVEGIVAARAERRPPSLDDLQATAWSQPDTALCLLVDRSGSMSGDRLVAAALATAICAYRAPKSFAVLTFSDRVIELKAMNRHRNTDAIVGDVLSLRGHGTTDLALALKAAQQQLHRSNARRRIVVLLSDAEATAGGDPIPVAKGIEELLVLTPIEDIHHAEILVRQAGGKLATVDGPMGALESLRRVLQ